MINWDWQKAADIGKEIFSHAMRHQLVIPKYVLTSGNAATADCIFMLFVILVDALHGENVLEPSTRQCKVVLEKETMALEQSQSLVQCLDEVLGD